MAKKKSLGDIAKELGVSKTLVSFVLNDRGDEKSISKKTQNAVTELAKKYNFTPSFLARGLRMGKTHTIGLIVADISNKFYAKIAREVEKVAAENNYNVIYCSSDESVDKEIELINMLRGRQVDGLIVATTQKDTSLFTQMKKENFPFVLIDRRLPRLKVNYVGSDNVQGAYDVTARLIKNGFKKIALFKISPLHLSSIKEREMGYISALKDHHIKVDKQLIKTMEFNSIQASVNDYLDELMKPPVALDAIFTLNNNAAIACLRYFKKYQYSIPQDVALISFDDIELFNLMTPGISAVSQPLIEIGKQAVTLLLEEINGKEIIKQELQLPVSFIERESCKKVLAEYGS